VSAPRRWAGVAAGLGLVALLLLLPAPRRHGAAAAAGPAASPSGPAVPTLATTWPKATLFSLPATFPDGSTYQPQLLLDATTSLGPTTSADGQKYALVVAGPDGQPRVLDSALARDGASFDAITPTADAFYWMRTVSDADGNAHVSLWTARRSGGPSREVTGDAGAALFSGSPYDMQAVGDRLYWLAGAGGPGTTQLRSVARSGGRVTVRALPGAWTMTAWPWVVTAPGATGTPVELFNLDTGARAPVRVPPGRMATCTPAWCRLVDADTGQSTGTDLMHPDGTGQLRVAGPNAIAFAGDVALLDRFEPVLTALSSVNTTTVFRLDLYDVAHRRTVLVEPAATNAAAKGGYLWWSTGDNETLAWHALDLRTLG
jgi:hypothetical protein